MLTKSHNCTELQHIKKQRRKCQRTLRVLPVLLIISNFNFQTINYFIVKNQCIHKFHTRFHYLVFQLMQLLWKDSERMFSFISRLSRRDLWTMARFFWSVGGEKVKTNEIRLLSSIDRL